MKRIVFIALFIFQCIPVKAQLALEWMRNHKISVVDGYGVTSFTTAPGGNSYFMGYLLDYSGDSVAAVIIKYNSEGFKVWEKPYPYSGIYNFNTYDHWKGIQTDAVENIYFVDRKEQTDSFFLVKLDTDGNLLYEKPLCPFEQNCYHYLLIDADNNANVVINTPDSVQLLYYKFDNFGNTLRYFSIPVLHKCYHMPMTLDNEGSIYLTHPDFIDGENAYRNYLRKIDTAGNILWTLQNSKNTYFGFLSWAPDGDLLLLYIGDETPSGISKIDPQTGIVTNHIDVFNLITMNATSDEDGNIYCTYYNKSENRYEVRKYDMNLNLRYSYASPNAFQTNIVPPQGKPRLLLAKNKELLIVTLPYDGSALDLSINFERIDTSGELIAFTHVSDTSQTMFTAGQGIDSMDNVYVGLRINKSEKVSIGDVSLVKVCNECIPNLHGHVFDDSNNNCDPDSGERRLSNRLINIYPENFYAFTDSAGRYSFHADTGMHIVHEVLPNSYWYYACDSAYKITVDTVNQVYQGLDFPNRFSDTINDLKISIASGKMRPGFDVYIVINYYNVGVTDLHSEVAIALDSALSFEFAYQLPVVNSGNIIVWDTGLLPTNSSGSITVVCHVSPTVALGTLLKVGAHINPVIDDQTPWNNVDTLQQIAVGSWDPNDKEVFPLSVKATNEVNDSTPFSYQINFQNTGTDTAFTVIVRDEIDKYLDLSAFEMQVASHPNTLRISGRTLEWTFEDILLPDSNTNEVLSHGFIKFGIRPQTNNSYEEKEINNSAEIYFDYNIPIQTNNVKLIQQGKFPLSEEEPENSLLVAMTYSTAIIQVYPNPAIESFVINYTLSQETKPLIQLIDLLGRIVFETEPGIQSKGIHSIVVSHLDRFAGGTYFLKLMTENTFLIDRVTIMQ
jgi:hypothetical protein